MGKLCSKKLLEAKLKASQEYWKKQAEAAGLEYDPKEPPQNLRKRIRDIHDIQEEVDYKYEVIAKPRKFVGSTGIFGKYFKILIRKVRRK